MLVGLNTKEEDKYNSITTIDFQPADSYFKIPTSQTEGHTRDQVIKKINNELNEFLKSEKFKSSFLINANSIHTDFSGEIWSR